MSSGTFPTACTPCKAVSCSCPKPGCLSSRSREEKPASLNFHVPLFRGDGITFPGSFCSWTGEFFHEPAFPGWHCGHALTSGLPSTEDMLSPGGSWFCFRPGARPPRALPPRGSPPAGSGPAHPAHPAPALHRRRLPLLFLSVRTVWTGGES